MSNECPRGLVRRDEVYFRNISEGAQALALEHKGVRSPEEADWDTFPMAYLPEGRFKDYSQLEIDLMALTNIGCFKLPEA